MSEEIQNQCPKCGAEIPENAPQGLCPACVLMGAETTPDPNRKSGSRAPAPAVEDVAPHFPELEILELIGAGGMGAVYKARQPHLGRLVALKVLPQDLGEDPAFAERFSREARVLAKLNHPNIVTVFDSGMAGPFCFLMMELVDGVNLRQAMRAGGFSAAESLDLVQEICAALKYAHGEGILHRDIKPENVLIDTKGRVKIADFGIAKLMGEGEPESVTLTVQGSALGSPHYMAPEQIENPGDVDQRADIYSLGVVFYELLTGELPLGRFAPPSERSETDPRLDEVIMRTLERQREERYQNVGEVQTSVATISEGGTPIPPPAPASAAAGAKFALTSAILTGLSAFAALPFWAVTAQLLPLAEVFQLAIMVGLMVVLTVVTPAFIGTILGFSALGDFRRSGGRKSGFGAAMFGALTWPILLIVVAIGVALPLFMMPLGGGVGIAEIFVVSWGIVAPLTLFFLTRSVARWAKQDKAWTSGGLRGVSIGMAVVALGFAAIVVVSQSGPGHESPPYPDFGMTDSALGVGSSSGDSRNSRQLLEMPLTVPQGFATVFELVRVNDIGEEAVIDLDWGVMASSLEPMVGEFRVEELSPAEVNHSTGAFDENRGARRGVNFVLATAWVGGLNHTEILSGNWAFHSPPQSPDLSEEGVHNIRLASEQPVSGSLTIGNLFLRVTCRKRTDDDPNYASLGNFDPFEDQEQKELERLYEMQLTLLTKQTEILESVVDEASAARAADKWRALLTEEKAIAELGEKLGEPDDELQAELTAAYRSKFRKLEKRYSESVARMAAEQRLDSLHIAQLQNMIALGGEGAQFALETLAELAETGPNPVIAADDYVDIFAEINTLLEGVTDGESARKVAEQAAELAKQWEEREDAFEAAGDGSFEAFMKRSEEYQANLAGLFEFWFQLREDPEIAEALEPLFGAIEEQLAELRELREDEDPEISEAMKPFFRMIEKRKTVE